MTGAKSLLTLVEDFDYGTTESPKLRNIKILTWHKNEILL